MATVPNADQAVVDAAKIERYLLSPTHPIGRAKADFFKRFGFRRDTPEELIDAVLAHVREHAIADTEASDHGIKYRVDGPLAAPSALNPRVSTVWIVLNGETYPRFVTAFPC
jgi:hypothetical protein